MLLNQETYNIYIASDHAGFALKQFLISELIKLGYSVEDIGAHVLDENDDYPDFVIPCAKKVAENSVDSVNFSSFGIIIGGNGQGEAVAANRIDGVRAVVYYGGVAALESLDKEGTKPADLVDIVRLSRLHDNANVLSLGARFISKKDAMNAVNVFLNTAFSNSERHIRRLKKI